MKVMIGLNPFDFRALLFQRWRPHRGGEWRLNPFDFRALLFQQNQRELTNHVRSQSL